MNRRRGNLFRFPLVFISEGFFEQFELVQGNVTFRTHGKLPKERIRENLAVFPYISLSLKDTLYTVFTLMLLKIYAYKTQSLWVDVWCIFMSTH